MSASSEVTDAFDRSEEYARVAMTQVDLFLAELNDAIYTPPTVSVTWNSIAPPSIDALPTAPTMPTITFNTPAGQPTELAIAEPTIVIDDFTEAAPVMDLPDAPVVSYGVAPTVATPATVSVPSAPIIVSPDAPSYISISTPTMAAIDLHPEWLDYLDTIPSLNLLQPTPFSYAHGAEYASALLTALKASILSRLSGGTGLDPAVEQAIWDRARSREVNTALANEAEIARAAEALGYQLPAGVLADQLRQAQQSYYDKLSEFSRDVAIKQAELEQDNLKTTIQQGMELEGKLIDYAYKLEQLTFETAKAYADNAVQIYNAGVDGYKALLAGYQMYASAYDTIIKGELAKVEVYKGQLQGEQTKAQVNQTMVEQYKAEIQAGLAQVEIFKSQVGAAQTLIEMEKVKIEASGEQIKAYVATINGETAKVEAYKAQVQAQTTLVTAYESTAKAFSAKVGAQADKAKAELGRYTALYQAKSSEWEGYKVKVQTESERIKALGLQSSTLLDGYKASAAAIEAESAMHTKIWETQIKDYEASQSIVLQTAKINSDAAIQTNNARLEASKVGAQVYAQLTASAYSMTHATASISASGGTSVNYSYSNDTTSAVPPMTYVG